MHEYMVIANRLNFRQAPETGAIIATLPRGHIMLGEPSAAVPDWLEVKTTVPQADEETSGFVSAQYASLLDAAAAPPAPPAAAGSDTPTVAELRRLAPSAKAGILSAIAEELPTTGADYGLTRSKMLMCHFLAQAAHEADGFRTTHEYWGPTNAQRRYEGRADLGNTRPGDGKRFMGRGLFQLTGRSNYRRYGEKLGLPLESNPELAADPKISFRIACAYWKARGIEPFAAADNIREVTRRINGGYNGLDARIDYYRRARRIFG